MKLCFSKNKRPNVNIVNDNVRTDNCTYIPLKGSCSGNQEKHGLKNRSRAKTVRATLKNVQS